MNMYSTSATLLTEEQLALGRSTDIVTFASPSSVSSWKNQVGLNVNCEDGGVIAVAIGPSSLLAARRAGFRQVHAPNAGLDSKCILPWAHLITELAMKEFHERNH